MNTVPRTQFAHKQNKHDNKCVKKMFVRPFSEEFYSPRQHARDNTEGKDWWPGPWGNTFPNDVHTAFWAI